MTKSIKVADLQWFGLDEDGYLHPKRTGEKWVLTFDAVARLSSGATVATATWTAQVHAGEDAAPSAILTAAPNYSGTKTSHLVIGGVSGVTYLIRAAMVPSTGTEIIYGEGLLKVEDY